MRIRLSGILCCAVLAGCATIEPPQPGAGHPASPQAAAARDTEASGVLAVDENNLPRTPPEMRRGMMHQDHGTMDAGTMGGGSSPTGRTVAAYTCPMHPEIITETPGKCPKCGMQLVPEGGADDE